MKILTVFLTLFFTVAVAEAQFFYKDILINRQLEETQQLYKKLKISQVKLLSYDGDSRLPVSDFNCRQNLSSDFGSLQTITQTPVNGLSVMTTEFNDQGRVKKVTDSTKGGISETIFTYNADGNLTSLEFTTGTMGNNMKRSEIHLWEYTGNGTPHKMTRIKNGNDTTVVLLEIDENGNVIEEKWYRYNKNIDNVYYYYDEKGRLTDIVRYNSKAKRLIPDYIFEYDEAGRVTKMLNVASGSSNYVTWVYQFNEEGLKTTESCFNKQKEMLGRVDYKYEKN